MSKVEVKRGKKKCRWPKLYECADGTCTRAPEDCVPLSGRNCPYYRPYLCPGDYCALTDTTCMRPCGTKNRFYHYKEPCLGIDEMCALVSSQCPHVCRHHKCLDGRCRPNELFCKPCRGFRCRLSGVCVPPGVQCDGRLDCPSGEDELLCPNITSAVEINSSNKTIPSVPALTWPPGRISDEVVTTSRFSSGAVGPASGFLFLMLIVLGICCRVKRGRQYLQRGGSETRALRRFMATIHHLSEAGHLRHFRNSHPRNQNQAPPEPSISPPSTPSIIADEPAPPYTEVDSSDSIHSDPVPPYTEREAPPSYEEAVAAGPNRAFIYSEAPPCSHIILSPSENSTNLSAPPEIIANNTNSLTIDITPGTCGNADRRTDDDTTDTPPPNGRHVGSLLAIRRNDIDTTNQRNQQILGINNNNNDVGN